VPVGVAEKRLVHSRSRGRCTMDVHTGGGGKAMNRHSRRGREIDGKHAYRSGGEKIVDVHSRERASERDTQQMHTAGGRNA